MADHVLITDVALRDGLQDEPVTLPGAEKLRLARGLVDAGLTSLEVGSFVNPAKVPQMADTEDVISGLAGIPAAAHALVFNERGAYRAIDSGARHVRLVVSASDGHSKANAGLDTARALDRLGKTAEVLVGAGIGLEACIATAFVCPFDGDTDPSRTAEVADRLIALGARVVHLADTIGAAGPSQVARSVTAVRDRNPAHPLGLHLHNTYGMASATVLRALQLGITRFDAALGGIGGCPFAPGASGNIATDDLVNLLHREGISTGIDVVKLAAVREQLATLLGHRLPSALAAIPAVPAAFAGR
ncbi:hydroxymethylglutaryl-CoA lyase [Amycolatopsis sp. K13G38]|uniref:Hydroxymethylglutaryl-CoA lyase n=1 Tax=Amycolatopsis acididurans TaxID=2724524 RepID=A0ABX1JDQ4_9PSEU|nr:hydroxymethylglutaryl-CoA lyase [Amycolatopsis acididurans]NKQ56994.1 hydroxymethylglutaryl-CoA lyase [Amycolatopsis acididurans]